MSRHNPRAAHFGLDQAEARTACPMDFELDIVAFRHNVRVVMAALSEWARAAGPAITQFLAAVEEAQRDDQDDDQEDDQ